MTVRPTRRQALAALGAVVTAGCTTQNDAGTPPSAQANTSAEAPNGAPSTPSESEDSGADDAWRFEPGESFAADMWTVFEQDPLDVLSKPAHAFGTNTPNDHSGLDGPYEPTVEDLFRFRQDVMLSEESQRNLESVGPNEHGFFYVMHEIKGEEFGLPEAERTKAFDPDVFADLEGVDLLRYADAAQITFGQDWLERQNVNYNSARAGFQAAMLYNVLVSHPDVGQEDVVAYEIPGQGHDMINVGITSDVPGFDRGQLALVDTTNVRVNMDQFNWPEQKGNSPYNHFKEGVTSEDTHGRPMDYERMRDSFNAYWSDLGFSMRRPNNTHDVDLAGLVVSSEAVDEDVIYRGFVQNEDIELLKRHAGIQAGVKMYQIELANLHQPGVSDEYTAAHPYTLVQAYDEEGNIQRAFVKANSNLRNEADEKSLSWDDRLTWDWISDQLEEQPAEQVDPKLRA